MYKEKVALDTFSAASEFNKVANQIDGHVYLMNEEGSLRVDAKSLMGVVYASSEWKEIFVVSDHDIYFHIREFVVGEST